MRAHTSLARRHLAAILLSLALPVSSVAFGGATEAAVAHSARVVTVSNAPKNVDEGDLFPVTVTVTSPLKARTVQVQTQTTDIFGTVQWTPVKTLKVASKAKHTIKLVANTVNSQKFRAVATYRDGKRVASKPFTVTVWTWTDLDVISSYYKTYGVLDGSQFGMNGDQYIGWNTYGSYGMWEKRYTPGRNCKAFRGDFGVTDYSADGSTAQFTLLTDETNVVYQSPTLVPGAVTDVQFDLDKPYRLSVQARNTSPDGQLSYPAIGNPQLLCTGL